MANKAVFVSAILLFGVFVSSNAVVLSCPQRNQSTPAKLMTFLESGEELRNYSRNGYTSRFTGEFRPIPTDLQVELQKDLPEYRFHIARMSVLIDPPQRTYDLILITSARTGEVQSFLWAPYWMIPPSALFGQLLSGVKVKLRRDALNKINSLAKLVAYAASTDVGQATAKPGKLNVKLLRDKKVFGSLELKIDKHLRLGGLSISGPDGKRVRSFV